jgi:hypothetical protein
VKNIPRILVVVGLVAAAGGPGRADLLDRLAEHSPFLAPGGVNRAPRGESAQYELRGVVFEDGRYRFSIHDKNTGEAIWATLGERDLPFVARRFNQETETLVIDYQGQALTLPLQQSQTRSAGEAPPSAPPPLPVPGQTGPAANPATPGKGAPAPPAASLPPGGRSPSEAEKLQQMADEIRRQRQGGPVPMPPKP